ncbi:MAG: BtpA/SgcQ family protein [Cyanobacteriota bacterium]|nr:BtpA/SgcQ family protein [Cyanobacteriota bacterium]
MDVLKSIFNTPHPIIGVVHLLPLPGSPRWGGSLEPVIAQAEQEATALAAGGVHGMIVENYHDAPFSKQQVDPAVVSAMSVVVQRLKNLVALPIGINVLRNDGHSALAIAACVGAQFIRVNVLSGSMVTDQGTIEGDAYHLLRYRRALGVDVKIFADVLVKHARPLGSPHLRDIVADTIERSLADAIILSGWATGQPPLLEDLEIARSASPHTPLLIGSGATQENIGTLMQWADGVIVASSLKRPSRNLISGGESFQVIDPIRVRHFVDSMHRHSQARPLPPPVLASN